MLTVAIQAGGESRRMGQDKALLPFLGEPLIVRLIRRLSPIAEQMLITTNFPADYRFLDVISILRTFCRVLERWEGCTPLCIGQPFPSSQW